MKTLELKGVEVLTAKELRDTDGGIIFLAGYAVGVALGVAGVYGGYHLIKWIEES